jgi:hypothetical protein
MSTGFAYQPVSKRQISPITKFTKAKRKYFSDKFKNQIEAAEEFKISKIIPDIKKEKLKTTNKTFSKKTKNNLDCKLKYSQLL